MRKLLLLLLLFSSTIGAINQAAKHQAMLQILNKERIQAQKNHVEKLVENRTALHESCDAGNLKLTQDLLDAGENPRAQDANGDTPLMLAIRNRNQAIVSLFASEQKRTKNPWYISMKEVEEAFILALYEAAQNLGYNVSSLAELKSHYRSEVNAFLQDRRAYIQRMNATNQFTQEQAQALDQKIYSDPIFALCLSLLPELIDRDIKVVKVYAETWGDSIWLATKYMPLSFCIYISFIVGAAAFHSLMTGASIGCSLTQ